MYDRDSGHVELRGKKDGEYYRVVARYIDTYGEGIARSLAKATAFALANLADKVKESELYYYDDAERP